MYREKFYQLHAAQHQLLRPKFECNICFLLTTANKTANSESVFKFQTDLVQK